eukprot:GFUD01039246.1.p1 GENE.GFUD01039246.1~~GFUD01039246.1.p1  ORF type:complete len:146 (+),score=35.91 GFUD01039246.1:47-484(+)
MSHRDKCHRLNVSKNHDSELILDLPVLESKCDDLNSEGDGSDTEDLETYSDPTYSAGSSSDDEAEVLQSSFCEMEVNMDNTCESAEISTNSLCESDDDSPQSSQRKWESSEVSDELSLESDDRIPASEVTLSEFDSELFLARTSL